MSTDINTLYATAQNTSTVLDVVDIVIMFTSPIIAFFATTAAWIFGVAKIGFTALKNDGNFDTKKLFLISTFPFLYMLGGAMFYTLGSVIMHAVYAHVMNTPVNLFTFIPENYDLSKITNSDFDLGNFLLNAKEFVKNAILAIVAIVYISIYVFYFSIIVDAIISKVKVTIIYNIVVAFFISIVAIVVATTYDNMTSSTLFKDGIELHNMTSHSISQMLKNLGIYYAKLAFAN